MSLADELYFALMSIGYHGYLGGAPDVLIKTMRKIAKKSIEKWRKDEKAMVDFAKDYLANKDIQWMTYKLDISTAERFHRLRDLWEYMIEIHR